jgi:hypothetical protein
MTAIGGGLAVALEEDVERERSPRQRRETIACGERLAA